MTDTTQTSARFLRGRAMLAQPFPEALAAELPPAEVERHAEIGRKLAEASRERARLRAAVADAAGADRQKAAEAAAKGKPLPKSTEAGLRERLAEADRVVAALEAGLLVSARTNSCGWRNRSPVPSPTALSVSLRRRPTTCATASRRCACDYSNSPRRMPLPPGCER